MTVGPGRRARTLALLASLLVSTFPATAQSIDAQFRQWLAANL